MYKPVIVKKEVDDNHYYWVDDEFYPSVTKILQEAMPTPFALRQWIGDVGNEKAQQKLEQAGARGSLIHQACEDLLLGGHVNLKENFPRKQDKEAIMGFHKWVNEYKPEIKKESHIEFTVASTLKYAGTLDIFCYIANEPWIIDIKTSSAIHPEHFLQITAYQEAFYEMTGIRARRGIVHLNPKCKDWYKFYQDEDLKIAKKPVLIDDFMCAYNMYLMLNGGSIPKPPMVDVFPETVSLI